MLQVTETCSSANLLLTIRFLARSSNLPLQTFNNKIFSDKNKLLNVDTRSKTKLSFNRHLQIPWSGVTKCYKNTQRYQLFFSRNTDPVHRLFQIRSEIREACGKTPFSHFGTRLYVIRLQYPQSPAWEPCVWFQVTAPLLQLHCYCCN